MKRSVKSVYLLARAAGNHAAPSLAPGEGLDGDVWAAHEFGGAELGDAFATAQRAIFEPK